MREILNRDEYRFLREYDNKVLFMGVGGSIGYGTNVESSDTDIRGVKVCSKEELLGFSEPTVVWEKHTDTRLYPINRIFQLWSKCNPECIELLGLRPEHYIYMTKLGEVIIDNRKLFLSKRVVNSFGGFANSQLRELSIYINNGDIPDNEREKQAIRTLSKVVSSLSERYKSIPKDWIQIKDDDSGYYVDMRGGKIPFSEFRGSMGEVISTLNSYGKVRHRNNKKSEMKLNKHIMHLFRIYFMGIDILEKGEVITYRENEHEFLMGIRNGKIDFDIIELAYELENRLKYAAENTDLPEKPNMSKIEELLVYINEETLKNGGVC